MLYWGEEFGERKECNHRRDVSGELTMWRIGNVRIVILGRREWRRRVKLTQKDCGTLFPVVPRDP